MNMHYNHFHRVVAHLQLNISRTISFPSSRK